MRVGGSARGCSPTAPSATCTRTTRVGNTSSTAASGCTGCGCRHRTIRCWWWPRRSEGRPMRRALFLAANAPAAAALVLLALDPRRDLTPVFALLAVAVALAVLAWQWPRCVGPEQLRQIGLRPPVEVTAARNGLGCKSPWAMPSERAGTDV